MTELGAPRDRVRVEFPDASGSVTLSWAAHTNVGLTRQRNEDSYLAGVPIFAVADGMGGHAAGDEASSAVVVRLAEAAAGAFTHFDEIRAALRRTTSDIAAIAASRDGSGVGTTVTGLALTLQAGQAYWLVFNIGDSRVYSHRDGELVQETIDHSAVQDLLDTGAITLAEAEGHPNANVITRALGFGVDPTPDFWLIPLVQGSRLLLCSDGLTREVNNWLIGTILGAATDPDDAAGLLVEATLEAGARDNVTALVIEVVEVSTETELGMTLPRLH